MHTLFLIFIWFSFLGDASLHLLFLAFPDWNAWHTPRTNSAVALALTFEIAVIIGLFVYGIH